MWKPGALTRGSGGENRRGGDGVERIFDRGGRILCVPIADNAIPRI
jgi:hypothetical protein